MGSCCVTQRGQSGVWDKLEEYGGVGGGREV